MTGVTETMIEAGCRERCRQDGLRADYMIHYVASTTHPEGYACDPVPQHMIGEMGRDGKLIVQAESMPLWRWKFYKSVKSELEAALAAREPITHGIFKIGDRVRKISGSSWRGRIVGMYSTNLTPIGYCVESENEPGSVQIYPEKSLELVQDDPQYRRVVGRK